MIQADARHHALQRLFVSGAVRHRLNPACESHRNEVSAESGHGPSESEKVICSQVVPKALSR